MKPYLISHLYAGLSSLEVTLIVGSCVIVSIFIVTSIILGVKFTRERSNFQQETERALQNFQTGFKDYKGINFESHKDYKTYELPMNQWDLSSYNTTYNILL